MGYRVLVVDDSALVRQMLKQMLRGSEFEVVGEAGNAAEALQVYGETKPDLVLMDVIMPDTSGIDALRQLKALDPYARVVMCSAVDQQATVVDSLEAGAEDFVVKPFRPSEVLQVLRRVVA